MKNNHKGPKALLCSASCATRDSGVAHNWPSVIRVREGLAGRDVLVPSCSSNSLWWAGRMHTDLNTLVRLAAGLREQCVMKQCGLAGLCFGGRMAFDLPLSRVSMGVASMGQVSNYQLDIMKKGLRKYKFQW